MTLRQLVWEFKAAEECERRDIEKRTYQAYLTAAIAFVSQGKKRMPPLSKFMPSDSAAQVQSGSQVLAVLKTILPKAKVTTVHRKRKG
jgi:hypothetical protein